MTSYNVNLIKRTVARSHRNARHALDVRRASLLAMLPVLRITYQCCSPRSPPSAAPSAGTDPSKFEHIFGKGAGTRGGDGGERGVQLFYKSAAGVVSAVKKKIKN